MAQVPAPQMLTLEQAEAAALANQPRLIAANLRAQAAGEQVRAARAGLFPTVGFNATGARVADTGAAIAAGNITTSSISNRFAYGGGLTQLVTDFGRTNSLVHSARSTAEAQRDIATLTRAQIRLNVREAYYQALGAEAVLHAAQAALANRQLVVRQLSALAASQLRSTLDVHFAEILESEAELAVVNAEGIVTERRAALATAMGSEKAITAPLDGATVSADTMPPAMDSLLTTAQSQRADLNAAKAQQHAAEAFAQSEKRLSYPTLNGLAAAGEIPYHDHTLHDDYAVAGFNLSIPVFTGGLFAARRAEAEFEARARARDAEQLSLEVNQQTRDAWSRAEEARKSLEVTARLVAQSKEALRLAQDRYDAGLGSIVELNEAQLNETSAEIQAADAEYTWLTRRAELDFAAGFLN